MKEEQADTSGITPGCLTRLMRFVELGMGADEVLSFAAHFQDCFECRDFAQNLSSLLEWRENVRTKLMIREGLRKE